MEDEIEVPLFTLGFVSSAGDRTGQTLLKAESRMSMSSGAFPRPDPAMSPAVSWLHARRSPGHKATSSTPLCHGLNGEAQEGQSDTSHGSHGSGEAGARGLAQNTARI